MQERLDYYSLAPGAMKGMNTIQQYLDHTNLDRTLLELVKLRASQLNGCAYCVDMHYKDARANGETEERLYMLVVWRESPLFTDRERAALAWTEAVTLVSETHVPDEVYEAARQQFSEQELVDLTAAIVLINGWNRFCVSFRSEPGHYQPKVKTAISAN